MQIAKSPHPRARSSNAACRSEVSTRSRQCLTTFAAPTPFSARRSSAGRCIIWRGKPKVRSPVKQSTRVAKCLGACAPPHDLPSTTNHQRGPFSRRLESHQCLEWAENRTHETARPSGPPHRSILRATTVHPTRRRPGRRCRSRSSRWSPSGPVPADGFLWRRA